MGISDSEYCREKERQKKYLIDIKEGFRRVLDDTRDKHLEMKTVPKIKVVGVLTKLLNL